MELNKYQELVSRTAGRYDNKDLELAIWALGVAGEAGEVADLVKKAIGHGHVLSRDEMTKEIGDVLWYCAMLAKSLNIELNKIAEKNLQKLTDRYPYGFNSHDSINRDK